MDQLTGFFPIVVICINARVLLMQIVLDEAVELVQIPAIWTPFHQSVHRKAHGLSQFGYVPLKSCNSFHPRPPSGLTVTIMMDSRILSTSVEKIESRLKGGAIGSAPQSTKGPINSTQYRTLSSARRQFEAISNKAQGALSRSCLLASFESSLFCSFSMKRFWVAGIQKPTSWEIAA